MINKLKYVLGIFSLREKVNDMQFAIDQLSHQIGLIDKTIYQLKSDTTLCRFSPHLGQKNSTTRYRVSDVVELLLEHHGLTIETIPAKDSCVKLVAKEEPKE